MAINGNVGDALPEVRTYGANYDPESDRALSDARAALAKAALAVAVLCARIESSGLEVPYDELFEVLK